MKSKANTRRQLAIISMVLITGFSMAACASIGGGDPVTLNGTWKDKDGEAIKFSEDSFDIAQNNKVVIKGTYTASARNASTNVTMVVKEVLGDFLNESLKDVEGLDITFDSKKWYNKDQVIEAFREWMKKENPSLTDAQISSVLNGINFNRIFLTMKGKIDGDTMNMGSAKYTKTA